MTNPLLIRQFVNRELGNSSYIVASANTRKAAIIDPERDVEKYIEAAAGRDLQIEYGLETHLHADFISGVHELGHALDARGQGAAYKIAVSEGAKANFTHVALLEGDRISLGDVQLAVIASPGHSREHISFLVYVDGIEQPLALFSGGSLIVGGTGRTDLHGEDETAPLAHELYATLHRKFVLLPDDVVVYPTHGAGSFCNTTTSADRVTTIGRERESNPFFTYDDEGRFVHEAIAHLSSFPAHYVRLPAVNRRGAPVLGGVPDLPALSAQQVAEEAKAGAIIVDVRDSENYLAKHIPSSYGIPVFTPVSAWAGWVLPKDAAIILVADAPLEMKEAVLQLIRIGHDNLRGYLDGGIAAWEAAGFETAHIENIPAEQLKTWIEDEQPSILDVRFDYEWDAGHLPGATLFGTGRLPRASVEQLPARDEPLVVHCKAGTRSVVAVSLLEQKGFTKLFMLRDGIEAWKQAGYKTVQDTATV